jgi:hypothetical protein
VQIASTTIFTNRYQNVKLRKACCMADKTFHVVSVGGSHWAVKKAGKKSVVYSSQGEAVKAATRVAKAESEAQVVIHKRDGKFVIKEIHGLPVVQKPPQRSSLGTDRISKAISAALQKRLETA